MRWSTCYEEETAGDPGADVLVTALNGDATVSVRTWAPDAASVEQFESELRLRLARRLREQSTVVSPPPGNGPRRRSRGLVMPGRRRQRRRSRARRRRKLGVILFLLVATAAALGAVGFGGATSISRSCDLNALQPASIGSNTFIYAADGSRSARSPPRRTASRSRSRRRARWMSKATVAIEDRRFYQHGGVDFRGIGRAVVNDIGRAVRARAARRSPSSSSATSTSATTSGRCGGRSSRRASRSSSAGSGTRTASWPST